MTLTVVLSPSFVLDRPKLSQVADDFFEPGVTSPQQILDFVKAGEGKKGCCTLYFVGHRGGQPRLNPGGAVTYPDISDP